MISDFKFFLVLHYLHSETPALVYLRSESFRKAGAGISLVVRQQTSKLSYTSQVNTAPAIDIY